MAGGKQVMENKITLPTNSVKVMKASDILANARERFDAIEQYITAVSSNRTEPDSE
jgi:hypothetical protein